MMDVAWIKMVVFVLDRLMRYLGRRADLFLFAHCSVRFCEGRELGAWKRPTRALAPLCACTKRNDDCVARFFSLHPLVYATTSG